MNVRFASKLPVLFAYENRPYRIALHELNQRFVICIAEADGAKRNQSVLNISDSYRERDSLTEAAKAGFEILSHDRESDVGRLVDHLVQSGLAVVGESKSEQWMGAQL